MPREPLLRDLRREDAKAQPLPAAKVQGTNSHQDPRRGSELARRERDATLVRFRGREVAGRDGAGCDVRLGGGEGDPGGGGGVEAGVGPRERHELELSLLARWKSDLGTVPGVDVDAEAGGLDVGGVSADAPAFVLGHVDFVQPEEDGGRGGEGAREGERGGGGGLRLVPGVVGLGAPLADLDVWVGLGDFEPGGACAPEGCVGPGCGFVSSVGV